MIRLQRKLSKIILRLIISIKYLFINFLAIFDRGILYQGNERIIYKKKFPFVTIKKNLKKFKYRQKWDHYNK